MQLRPIYTEPENCQDCYKCIRECPVKAIRMEDNKASIIAERCIYCGHCTQVCPTGAKKIRDGLTRAKMTLAQNKKVFLSLAPSYVSEFGDIPSETLVAAIKRLGFTEVSETALGAEIVTDRTEKFLAQAENSIYISSACPVVVEYIRKYSPEHVHNITPVVSPMLAHAKIIKQLYGEDTKIVFAGPCICKKLEADTFKDLVEVVITFKDLRNWFEQAEIDLRALAQRGEREKFVPYRSGLGSLYPIEGGMLKGLHKNPKPVHNMAFSDLSTIKEVLKHLDTHRQDDSIFLELLACKGGCINGPAHLSQVSPALKRYEIIQKSDIGDPKNDFKDIDLQILFCRDPQITEPHYTEEEIKQALAAVGKTTPQDELNCSGCGYDSCRDFAIAMLEGRAEENMCVSYMRKIAHDKATVLLQKIPAGVMLVNDELKITDMNAFCASLLGEDIETIYEVSPGLNGMEVGNICSFEDLFRAVLTTGKEITERQVRENDKTWILSIYNIQPHRLVFGILQDLREPLVRKEWILEKTQEVIKKHMETVQQVACLLGENAAFTDATLRTVMDAFKKNDLNTL